MQGRHNGKFDEAKKREAKPHANAARCQMCVDDRWTDCLPPRERRKTHQLSQNENCHRTKLKILNVVSNLNTFDFVGLTETWLNTNDNSYMYNLPDYTLLTRPRTDKGSGGVDLYVTDNTRFKV